MLNEYKLLSIVITTICPLETQETEWWLQAKEPRLRGRPGYYKKGKFGMYGEYSTLVVMNDIEDKLIPKTIDYRFLMSYIKVIGSHLFPDVHTTCEFNPIQRFSHIA